MAAEWDKLFDAFFLFLKLVKYNFMMESDVVISFDYLIFFKLMAHGHDFIILFIATTISSVLLTHFLRIDTDAEVDYDIRKYDIQSKLKSELKVFPSVTTKFSVNFG